MKPTEEGLSALQLVRITVAPPIQLVEIEDRFYQLGPESKHTFNNSYVGPIATLPVIVLPFMPDGQVAEDTFAQHILKFADEDDVFCPEFMATVIVQQYKDVKTPSSSHTSETIRFGKEHLPLIRMAISREHALPVGPYFLHGNELREAWRLYPDDADAFFAPLELTPMTDGTFSPLKVSGIFGPSLAVAVPSRLYFEKSSSKPLNGMRIAVKDSFDVKGIHTVVSNKSFLKYRAPATETSPVIRELLAKGAILVGKTKMTTFADREYPPSDWIDYHCPFNPRGDGYLVTEGSSSGSAAAVATYDWLDASLGTDTSGSVRAPAAAQGIFGLRPSHGAISTKAVIPLVPRFDVVGFMTRDIHKMQRLARELLPNETPSEGEVKFPKKLIRSPTWLGNPACPQIQILFEEFVAKLREFLGVGETLVDFGKEWTKDDPMGTGKTFDEEFLRTYERIHTPAAYEYQSAWADDYAEMFGKAPYLPPALKNRWPYGKTIMPDEVAKAWAQVDAFEAWFGSKYLSPDKETGSSAIVVDCWTWDLNYRNALKETPNTGCDYGFGPEFNSSFSGVPEFVFCIGQYRYESEISQTTEYAPVAMSILSAKGSDRMLLQLVEDFLAFAGLPSTVLAGKTAFSAEDHRLPPDWEL